MGSEKEKEKGSSLYFSRLFSQGAVQAVLAHQSIHSHPARAASK
jgi:hypothetical protein